MGWLWRLVLALAAVAAFVAAFYGIVYVVTGDWPEGVGW